MTLSWFPCCDSMNTTQSFASTLVRFSICIPHQHTRTHTHTETCAVFALFDFHVRFSDHMLFFNAVFNNTYYSLLIRWYDNQHNLRTSHSIYLASPFRIFRKMFYIYKSHCYEYNKIGIVLQIPFSWENPLSIIVLIVRQTFNAVVVATVAAIAAHHAQRHY